MIYRSLKLIAADSVTALKIKKDDALTGRAAARKVGAHVPAGTGNPVEAFTVATFPMYKVSAAPVGLQMSN